VTAIRVAALSFTTSTPSIAGALIAGALEPAPGVTNLWPSRLVAAGSSTDPTVNPPARQGRPTLPAMLRTSRIRPDFYQRCGFSGGAEL